MILSGALRAIGVALIVLPVVSAGCGEDIDLLPVGDAHLVTYSHSDECAGQGDFLGLDPGDAVVEVEVDGLQVTVRHKNAILNCCLDSITVTFDQNEKLLKLSESEEVTTPCDCICPFEVVATLEVSVPGGYIIEVWTESNLVWSGEVEVGGR